MTPAAAHTTARRLVALLKAVTDSSADTHDHDALSRAYELLGLAIDLATPLADHLDAAEGRALQEAGLMPPPAAAEER